MNPRKKNNVGGGFSRMTFSDLPIDDFSFSKINLRFEKWDSPQHLAYNKPIQFSSKIPRAQIIKNLLYKSSYYKKWYIFNLFRIFNNSYDYSVGLCIIVEAAWMIRFFPGNIKSGQRGQMQIIKKDDSRSLKENHIILFALLESEW